MNKSKKYLLLLSLSLGLLFSNIKTLSAQYLLEKGKNQVFDFVILPQKGEMIFQEDQDLRVIWISTLLAKKEIALGTDQVISSMSASANESVLAAGFIDGSIRLYDLGNDLFRHSLPAMKGIVTSICFSPDSKFLAAASENGDFRVYRLKDSELVTEETLPGFISEIEFSDDNRFIAGGGERIFFIWDMESRLFTVKRDLGEKQWIRAVEFDAEGNRVITCNDGGEILSWSHQSEAKEAEPVLLYRESPWLSSLDVDFKEPELFVLSGYYGKIRVRFPGGEYNIKEGGMIYKTRIIAMEPELRIVSAVKDKGLVVRNVKEMKSSR